MSSSISTRYLEFNGVALDLRHMCFSADGLHDSEYIIFLNVHRAIFTNFKVYSDLSLESLAEFIFEKAVCSVDGCEITRRKSLGESVNYNEYDRKKSLCIQLHDKARIIVAKTIYHFETYHQRASGFVDFENRHNKHYDRPSDEKRLVLDREYEIKLLEFT
ncbi:asb107 [Agrotis segetum nucleopolyhedrovirus B]|uniref:Asb107 n=1 Tax=Agrotis segetum nucleopolyhedrovirus B TaxID=1580580 RepID=A0A0A7KR90_9ABAC|nr:asb107 [Agrotis segetum nucleopolyhedrovirus B]AIZ48664.1 asb107 [Agrotis segetum nucleopolyhedrovirus B]